MALVRRMEVDLGLELRPLTCLANEKDDFRFHSLDVPY